MISIEIPDVGIADFPDGTSDEAILSSLRESFPDHPAFKEPAPVATASEPDVAVPAGYTPAMEARMKRDPKVRGIGYEIERKTRGGIAERMADVPEAIASGIASGAVSGVQGVRRAVGALEDRLGEVLLPGQREQNAYELERLQELYPDRDPATIAPETQRVIRGYADAANRGAIADKANQLRTVLSGNRAPGAVREVAAAVGSTIPTAAAFAVNPAVGFATAGAQQGGDTYQQAVDFYRKLGYSQVQAEQVASGLGLATGTVTGVTTALIPKGLGKIPGVGRYLGQGVEDVLRQPVLTMLAERGWKTAAAEGLKRIAGEMTSEAIEEGSQEVLVLMIDMKSSQPDLTWEQVGKQALKAFALGGAAAGVLKGGRAAVEAGVQAVPAIVERITPAQPEVQARPREATHTLVPDIVRERVAAPYKPTELDTLTTLEEIDALNPKQKKRLKELRQETLAVDSSKPATFYHGTKGVFDVQDINTSTGAYFSQNKSYAERPTMGGDGGRILEANLEMRNPLVFEKGGRLPTMTSFYKLTPEKIAEYKSKGYDSLQLRHPDGTIQEAVVFDKSQVRAASPDAPVDGAAVAEALGVDFGSERRARLTPDELARVPEAERQTYLQLAERAGEQGTYAKGEPFESLAGKSQEELVETLSDTPREQDRQSIIVRVNGKNMAYPVFKGGKGAITIKTDPKKKAGTGLLRYLSTHKDAEVVARVRRKPGSNTEPVELSDGQVQALEQHVSTMVVGGREFAVPPGVAGLTEGRFVAAERSGDSATPIAATESNVDAGLMLEEAEAFASDQLELFDAAADFFAANPKATILDFAKRHAGEIKRLMDEVVEADEVDPALFREELMAKLNDIYDDAKRQQQEAGARNAGSIVAGSTGQDDSGNEPAGADREGREGALEAGVAASIRALESLEQKLRSGTYSDPFLLTPVATLAMKLLKLGLYAGKPLARALDDAIAKAREVLNAGTDPGELWSAIRNALQTEIGTTPLGGEQLQPLKDASARLANEAYATNRYKAAKRMLTSLRERMVAETLGRGEAVDDVPWPMDEEFADELARLDIPHDPEQVKELQAAVRFEDDAAGYVERTAKVATLNQIARVFGQNPKHKEAVKGWKHSAGQITRWLRKKATVEHNGQTVAQRAAEMETNERARISNQAKANVLESDTVRGIVGDGASSILGSVAQDYPELNGRSLESVLTDDDISDGRKEALLVSVQTALETFEAARKQAAQALTAEEAKLKSRIAELSGDALEAQSLQASEEILIQDAIAAMAGEQGRTGDLNGLDAVRWFKENQGAVWAFAQGMARNAGNDVGAQQMLDWLLVAPDGGVPTVQVDDAARWGVTQSTMDAIRNALSRSGALRNSVARMVEFTQKRIPYDRLKRIADLVEEGNQDEAELAFDKLVKRAEREGYRQAVRAERLGDELAETRLKLETLRETVKFYDSVSQSEPFQLMQAGVGGGPNAFHQRMVLNSDGVRTFLPFKAQEIDQPELKIEAAQANTPDFYSRTLADQQRWFWNAENYVAGYDAALDAFLNGSGPTPSSLGYDLPTYRGLRVALEKDRPALLDTGINTADTALLPGRGLAAYQGTSLTTEHANTVRNLFGAFGVPARFAMADYGRVLMDARALANSPRFRNLNELRSRALRSHPELGNDVQLYRDSVLNPMGEMGRVFGSDLKTGATLWTGQTVTAEDMALFRLTRDYENSLLRKAQFRPDRATRQNVAGRELSRNAASVGDQGRPRRISDAGQDVSGKLANHYRRDKLGFSALDDLSSTSRNSTVQFWNRLAVDDDALTSHLLNAVRTDRAIRQDPRLLAVEKELARDVKLGGYRQHFRSVGELVDALVAKAPATMSRDYIVAKLNEELADYGRLAIESNPVDAANQSTVTQVEQRTANNEFTKSAGLLELPGVYYDYGVLTTDDLWDVNQRAAEPYLVELVKALEQSAGEMQAMIDRADPKGSATPDPSALPKGVDVKTARAVLHSVRKLIHAAMTPPSPQGALSRYVFAPFNFISRSLLAGPGVVLKNLTLGRLATFRLSQNVSAMGRGLSLLSEIKAAAKAIPKLVTRAIAGIPGLNRSAAWVKRNHPGLYRALFQWAEDLHAKMIGNAISDVRGLGFGREKSLTKAFMDEWRKAYEFRNASARRDSWLATDPSLSPEALEWARAFESLYVGPRSFLAAFNELTEKAGLESSDDVFNATVAPIVDRMQVELQRLATRYAKRIGGVSSFDVNDPTFLATEEDWDEAGPLTVNADRRRQLANFRDVLSLAGISVEQALAKWIRNGASGPVLDADQLTSLKRTVLAEVNANTGLNRPLSVQNSRPMAALLRFWGYPLNLMGKLASDFRNTRGGVERDRLMEQFAKLASFVALLIAGFTVSFLDSGLREAWERFSPTGKDVTGKLTPLDPEFYSVAGLKQNAVPFTVAALPLVGNIALPIMQAVVAGKGYNPGSMSLAISLASELSNYLTRLRTLPKEDAGLTTQKLLTRMVPVTETVLNQGTVGSLRRYNAGVNALRQTADLKGLLPEKATAGGGNYPVGKTTGMREKLQAALVEAVEAQDRGDSAGFQTAMHEAATQAQRIMRSEFEDAIAAGSSDPAKTAMQGARQSYTAWNPAQRALGKKPTAEQYAAIVQGMSGPRLEAWRKTLKAYQLGNGLFQTANEEQQAAPQPFKQAAGTTTPRRSASRRGYRPASRMFARGRRRRGVGTVRVRGARRGRVALGRRKIRLR